MKYFVANWKANKTYDEAVAWMNEFIVLLNGDVFLKKNLQDGAVRIVICPPAPFLIILKPLEDTFPNVFIGAQNISDKESGAFTGEVTAKTLQSIVKYTIIGHSERRTNYEETNKVIEEKVKQSLEQEITPILCIREHEDTIFEGVKIVAFEPVSAIGTGNNMPVADVLTMKKNLNLPTATVFLYGGSVTAEAATEYLSSQEIDGFLIGGASLKPSSFLDIVRQA